MPSAHSQVMPKKCITCHMHKKKKTDASLKKGGHTLRPDDAICLKCHEKSKALVEKRRLETVRLLEQLKALLDNTTDKKSEYYRKARLNYDIVIADGGMGTHNPKYAQALLKHSISSLTGEKLEMR